MVVTAVTQPARGEVTFEADGRTWRLLFATNALCRLEAQVDDADEIKRLVGDLDETPQFNTVRAAVWAALQDNHPGLSFDDAGRLVDHVGLRAMGSKIGQAIALAWPEAKVGAPDPRKARRPKGGRG
ncbi:hypothetical protein [Phenylobacterium sp.]|uniref:hypothetical protein n=1 Tax=Phenylobacterium sp. TaxID=1871053 RepID=UPI00393FCBBF